MTGTMDIVISIPGRGPFMTSREPSLHISTTGRISPMIPHMRIIEAACTCLLGSVKQASVRLRGYSER